jgi:hypothetical protein
MIGSAMVTMAIELLFCLNNVVFLSVVLRVKRFNLIIRDTNSNYCSNFGNFSEHIFFCLADILWQIIT